MIGKWYERLIVKLYVRAGTSIGDAYSYGYNNYEYFTLAELTCFYFLERRYEQLGYEAITMDEWIYIGGYGDDVNNYLYKPLDRSKNHK